MALIDRYKKLADKYKNDPEYLLEGLMIDVTEQIVREMENNNISRTQLAQKLGCSNAYITKLLSGTGNLTLKKLLEISAALDCTLDLAFVPKKQIEKQSRRTKFNNDTTSRSTDHRPIYLAAPSKNR
jgi:transcriptional regulator with XRE-family HTH domain